MANTLVLWILGTLILSAIAAPLVWWLNRIHTGAPLRPWLLGLLALGSFFLFLVVERPGWAALGVGSVWLDLIVLALAAFATGRYTTRRVALRPGPNGQWLYRIGFTLPAIWFLLLVLRLLIEFSTLPHVSILGTPGVPWADLTPGVLAALLMVGLLFAVSTGLLIGQYGGVYLRYRRLGDKVRVPAGAL